MNMEKIKLTKEQQQRIVSFFLKTSVPRIISSINNKCDKNDK